jgi:2-keto-3-deoxy-L-rhamnonate aldolase RhmA|tara:strand:+ start:114 stop:902 length:789 start_codon:yes stop_codon:yes gene_type:complete
VKIYDNNYLMKTKSEFIKSISSKGYSIGSWLSTDSLDITEIMSNAGFEWLVVDLEHSSTSINKAAEMIRIIDLSGKIPLVRLTSNNPDQIKRVMDSGAHGIIIPNINTSEQAISAVKSTRYAPTGNRGVGLARAQAYGAKFKEYLRWQKKSPIVIVQIEDIKAISNLDKIFSIEEVDGFIIGPYDLSCSMGIPGEFNNSKFKKVLNEILSAGKRNKCFPGIHIVEPDKKMLKKSIADGYQLIAYSVDIRMIDVMAREGLSSI